MIMEGYFVILTLEIILKNQLKILKSEEEFTIQKQVRSDLLDTLMKKRVKLLAQFGTIFLK